MSCERYLELEEFLSKLSPNPTESYDHDQHDAYGTAVIIALRGVLSMSAGQFYCLHDWFLNIQAKLILCDDIDVRNFVSEIYIKHVHPLVRMKDKKST